MEAVRAVLKERRRSPLVVRLEVGADMPAEMVDLLARELEIDAEDVYPVAAPLDLGGLFDVCKLDRPDLKFRPWTPITPPRIAHDLASSEGDLFRDLREDQVLVHHPYDSFEHTVEAFIELAAEDPQVLAIKQTLYRTSGPVSPIIRSLTRAAEAGKQVVALVELTARFDEQNNINWAEVLEDAGVHVVYGAVGLKTHAKVTLVVREEPGGIRRYCHVGTGNYNRDTARVYEDLGLLSADAALGADVGELFNSLTGYSHQAKYRKLLVAPGTMRPALLKLIRREAERGEAGRIVIKVNNLVDPEMIGALCAASQAGVEIDLIVRSICCLLPGVPGLSDNIRVRSLVGRYLEHSRILRFGRDATATPTTTSAPRTSCRATWTGASRRAVPIRSADLRARLDEILEINLERRHARLGAGLRRRRGGGCRGQRPRRHPGPAPGGGAAPGARGRAEPGLAGRAVPGRPPGGHRVPAPPAAVGTDGRDPDRAFRDHPLGHPRLPAGGLGGGAPVPARPGLAGDPRRLAARPAASAASASTSRAGPDGAAARRRSGCSSGYLGRRRSGAGGPAPPPGEPAPASRTLCLRPPGGEPAGRAPRGRPRAPGQPARRRRS